MATTQRSVYRLFTAVCLLAAAASCRKTGDAVMQQPRMFKPGDIDITTAETEATLTWNPSLFTTGRAVTYTVQYSKDSTFATGVDSLVVDTSKAVLTDARLQVRQDYFARVKANAFSNIPQSGWVRSERFSISGEQIFQALLGADVIDNAVLLKWRSTPALVKIVLSPVAGGAAIEVPLDAADITAQQKLVSGLQPGTDYSAEIFDATRSKGFLTFRTRDPLSGNIIDLRGITGRPSVLTDTLPLIPAGSTVVLRRGETYVVSATHSLSKSVKIMSGADLTNPVQAVISLPSNFNVAAGSSIDYIDFDDVYLKGTDYTSKYVFNVNNACTIGRMSFENCRAEIFRGMVRLQTAVINMTEFRINNSIVDSVSNYGIINVDNANCKVQNIRLTNSTIYKAEKIIVSRQVSESVLIENCTINEAPWGGGAASNFVIDYSQSATNTVTNGITIRNTIFGISKSNGGNVISRGIRTNAATVITVSNNYKTTDYLTAGNDIPNLIAYNGSMINLWEAPLSGDFRIKDQSFPGRTTAGDPRWR